MMPSKLPNRMNGTPFHYVGLIVIFPVLKVFYVTFRFFADGHGKILAGGKMICANHLYQSPCIA